MFCGALKKELRKRLVKFFVWSVPLYGAGTWTLRRSEEKRLEAFEMWIWRRMECVKWTDRMRNEAVLERKTGLNFSVAQWLERSVRRTKDPGYISVAGVPEFGPGGVFLHTTKCSDMSLSHLSTLKCHRPGLESNPQPRAQKAACAIQGDNIKIFNISALTRLSVRPALPYEAFDATRLARAAGGPEAVARATRLAWLMSRQEGSSTQDVWAANHPNFRFQEEEKELAGSQDEKKLPIEGYTERNGERKKSSERKKISDDR
ncbi:hypothetical protein ANN_18503 [Periplaneta americana]|uniref:Uncharacterized protein n=1 Tax=Periplaneta americana TaxID=6978 RepID=A0ABQ8SNX6_PERAM|nr:hypothetical protein ANN_18503 [Periplaneta americana]